ncbi:hypothetical protein SNEBB_011206 [Seison nebaliae]|nr:hypothetical protein SNEBB_011206 [Seison nebaliae]
MITTIIISLNREQDNVSRIRANYHRDNFHTFLRKTALVWLGYRNQYKGLVDLYERFDNKSVLTTSTQYNPFHSVQILSELFLYSLTDYYEDRMRLAPEIMKVPTDMMEIPLELYDHFVFPDDETATELIARDVHGFIIVTIIHENCSKFKQELMVGIFLRYHIECTLASLSLSNAVIVHWRMIDERLMEKMKNHLSIRIFTPTIIYWNDDYVIDSHSKFTLFLSYFHINWTMTSHTYSELPPTLKYIEKPQPHCEKTKLRVTLLPECFSAHFPNLTDNVNKQFFHNPTSDCRTFFKRAKHSRVLDVMNLSNSHFTFQLARFVGRYQLIPNFSQQRYMNFVEVRHYFRLATCLLYPTFGKLNETIEKLAGWADGEFRGNIKQFEFSMSPTSRIYQVLSRLRVDATKRWYEDTPRYMQVENSDRSVHKVRLSDDVDFLF